MMPIRRSLLPGLFVFLLLLSPALRAQTPAPDAAPAEPQTLEQASAQRERAKAMHKSAEERYVVEQEACYRKFLVSSCLEDAKNHYTRSVIEARNIDIPAREFQREAKRAEVDAREAQRLADTPRREAEQKEQGKEFRSANELRAAEREQKIAAKAQQAAEGRRKLAAEQAQWQARQDERAKKDAERAARKASEDARAEAEAAARVPKP